VFGIPAVTCCGVSEFRFRLPAGKKRRHDTIVASDFWPAFLGIAIISATSLFLHAGLPRDAGAKVSGHEVQEELKAEGLIK
jgi:hypothetical protein